MTADCLVVNVCRILVQSHLSGDLSQTGPKISVADSADCFLWVGYVHGKRSVEAAPVVWEMQSHARAPLTRQHPES